MNSAQQYCLRWNNHRTNLLRVFDELLQNEEFTDVTIVCDGGSQIKCHKMVLAACSPYFQNLFSSLSCKHPTIVLKDVKYIEIKAILEYMYRGEVNVAQNQLAALLKIAEALKVKGLVEENRPKDHHHQKNDDPMDDVATSCSPPSHLPHLHHHQQHQNVVHSSSSANNSPPHSSTPTPNTLYKNPYASAAAYNKNPNASTSDRPPGLGLPIWAVPGMPSSAVTPPSPIMATYETGAPGTGDNQGPAYGHIRKKFSNLILNRDTPILRTVLGQGQADSSQPVSLVCHADTRDESSDHESYKKHMKNEPLEDAQSPYTDFHHTMSDGDDVKPKMAQPSSSPQSVSGDSRAPSITSGIANYVPAQRPEWKRYKQYTRNEIMSAIDAVRNGMSALQAARKYGVPSRTLYDKVKKLGITTSRPFKRGSNGSSPGCFRYIRSPTHLHHHHQDHQDPDNMSNNNITAASLIDASYLQHALDARHGDDALTAMAVAAAAHAAAASAASVSPSALGHASSPSPSPTLLKYMRNSPPDAPMSETNGSSVSEREYEDDAQVEDLSIARKPQDGGGSVIVPPMNIKNEEDTQPPPTRREIEETTA